MKTNQHVGADDPILNHQRMKYDTGISLGENNTEEIPNKDLMNVHI